MSEDYFRGIDRNVAGFVGHRVFRNLVFHYVLVVPLYLSSGMTIADIAIIESAYWTAKSLADVPTGYFSDIIGCREAVVLGSSIVVFGFLIIANAVSLLEFCLGSGVLAFGHALCSGADSAMVHNGLEHSGRASLYPQAESIGWACRNIALAFACVVSYLLVEFYSLRQIVIVSAIFTIPAALFPLLIIRGPRKKESMGLGARVRGLGRTALTSGRQAWPPIALFVVFLVIDFLGNWLFQLAMLSHGVAKEWLGAAYAGVLTVSASTLLFAKNKTAANFRRTAGLLLIVASGYYFFVAVGIATEGTAGLILLLFGFGLYAVFRGLYFPIARAEISRLASSETRATIHSVATFLGGVSLAVVNPIVGNLIEQISLEYVLFLLFGVALCLAALVHFIPKDFFAN